MVNYEFITQYIRNTLKKSQGLILELEDYAKDHNVPIVQPEVAALLRVLISIKRPIRVLEIGTAIGYSAIIMAQCLPEYSKIDTIEINEDSAKIARDNIKLAGKKEVINVIIGDALEVLPCLSKTYDMIFIDAAKGQYLEFFEQSLRMLADNGLLVSDNILYKGMVAEDELLVRRKRTLVTRLRDYLKVICHREDLETSIIPIGDGVALSYRKSSL